MDERDDRLCERISSSIANAFSLGFEKLISTLANPNQKKDVEELNTVPVGPGPSSVPLRVNLGVKSQSGRSSSAVKLDFVVDLTKEGNYSLVEYWNSFCSPNMNL